MEIFIGTDTESIELFFNIFTSGIETFVKPWYKLLLLYVVEVCRMGLEPFCPRTTCTSLSALTKSALILLQGDPLWCQCIDCCLVSWVMCANPCFITCDDPVQKLVAVKVPLQKSQWWLHALCFVFCCQLFWHPPCTQFSEQVLCATRSRKWLQRCVFVKRSFFIMHSRTSSIMMDGLPLWC